MAVHSNPGNTETEAGPPRRQNTLAESIMCILSSAVKIVQTCLVIFAREDMVWKRG